MITIDGSTGEGGGQIVRSALALSIVTGRPFRVEKIRAGRKRPGLMRQHLTAVRAAAQICGGAVEGDEIGSTALSFNPKVNNSPAGETPAPSNCAIGGDYHFSIGTAGSTTLVLQTILLPLLLAERPSRVTLEGGTHNPFAPPFDFLNLAYLPLVNRMGPRVDATLELPGFYPAGGGKFVVDIQPCRKLSGFDLLDRGALRDRMARAAVSHVPVHVAERELNVVRQKLSWGESQLEVREIRNSPGPGNVLTLELLYENVSEVFTGFGEVGRSAEVVANAAVEACQRYLKGSAPVGEYLTDQLMLPMAVAGGGSFRSVGLSRHATTHIELIRMFLDVGIETKRLENGEVLVRIGN